MDIDYKKNNNYNIVVLQSLLYKRGVDMRKKVIGGIVLGVVAVVCLAALIISKETKDDEKTIPEREIKKVEKTAKVHVKPLVPQPKVEVKKDLSIKTDLYKGVPDSLLPLSAISEIASLNGHVHKTIKELVDNSTGVLYAKCSGNKLIMVVENPDDNRHGLEFVEISADGKHEKIGFLLSKYSEGNTDEDLWEYDVSEDVKRPTKHTKYNSDGDVEFVETWNYSSDEPIKYELKNKDDKVISLVKETIDENNSSMRQEHLIYDKDGKTKVNLTVNYDGADLTRFTYYNADKPNESGSVISEYKDGVKTKETVYTSDYKVKNVYEPEYKNGEREGIKVFNDENKEVKTLLSE